MSWSNLVNTLASLTRNNLPRCEICGMWFTPSKHTKEPKFCSKVCSGVRHEERRVRYKNDQKFPNNNLHHI